MNERGQYGKPSGLVGAPAIAIGVAAIFLAPVVAIVVGSAAVAGLGSKR